ncbi:MAG: Ni/Fe hydrogenase subunit alpha [Dehalococcoidales bacterium]|jgi:coenzyme F420-reducing hydrogenase alpha subunit
MTQVNINVHHLTRVEGHGNIVLNVNDGKIEELKWIVSESPRFFEVMMRDRYYEDVNHIASRICGICSISHSTVSLQATEKAFGVKPSEQTVLLRKLLFNAEVMESHILHIMFLAAPDFLGVGSVFPLINTHKDIIVMSLRLKRLSYNLAEALAGRKTHPLSCIVGGFAKLPQYSELEDLRKRLEDALIDLATIVDLFKTLKIPDFQRETEYIALKDENEYAFISGQIASSDTGLTPVENYLKVTNEFCVPQSTAKYTKNARDSYMVGALARFNINHEQLLPKAKSAAAELGLVAPNINPFMITVAQLIEVIHVVQQSIQIIDRLFVIGIKEEPHQVNPKRGRGIASVEAPRGILFHDYTYGEGGILKEANCVIPTNQNHNNIQKDFEALVPAILQQPEEEIQHTMEMLVRAYDPCISCSAHMLKVSFK